MMPPPCFVQCKLLFLLTTLSELFQEKTGTGPIGATADQIDKDFMPYGAFLPCTPLRAVGLDK